MARKTNSLLFEWQAYALLPFLLLNSLVCTAQTNTRDVQLQASEIAKLPNKDRRFALIIGIDEYEDSQQISRLSGAVNDAKALAQILEQYGGFPKEQIFTLTSDKEGQHKPNKRNILKKLASLLDAITQDGANGLLLVAFAGHGKSNVSEAYLLPWDVDLQNLQETAVTASELRNLIRAKRVEQVLLILDACRSAIETGRTNEENVLTDAYKRGFNFDTRNREVSAFATLYATGLGQRAYEFDIDGRKRGYFSYFLEKGLSGRGDTVNDKGEVTLSSLVSYLQKAVPNKVLADGIAKGRIQKPFADIQGFRANELVIAKVSSEEKSLSTTGPSENAKSSPATLPSFEFETAKINSQQLIVERQRKKTRYYAENFGEGTRLDMVEIPPGTFSMGTPSWTELVKTGASDKYWSRNETPQHQVTIRSFYMSKYEITQAQWRAVAKLPKIKIELSSDYWTIKGDNLPVDAVSWEAAVEFSERLSRKTGRKYRLPTEAEWEYACRAGSTSQYSFGPAITLELANLKEESQPFETQSRDRFTPVGYLGLANDFGLYDVHGNASEWCLDPWHESYNGAPTDGSVWEEGGDLSQRVVRGGYYGSSAYSSRSSARMSLSYYTTYLGVGFRVVTDSYSISPQRASNMESSVETDSPSAVKESVYWDSIKNSSKPQDYQEYLKRFPNGLYAPKANEQLSILPSLGTATTVLHSKPNNRPRAPSAKTGASRIVTLGIPAEVQGAITSPETINHVAFTQNGGSVVVKNNGDVLITNIPKSAMDALEQLVGKDAQVTNIAFAPNGGWVIISGPNGYWVNNVSPSVVNGLNEINKTGRSVEDIIFTSNGSWIIVSTGMVYWSPDIPGSLASAIRQTATKGEIIRKIAIMPGGGWIIINGTNGFWTNDIPEALVTELKDVNSQGKTIQQVTSTPTGGWIVISK